MAQTYIGNIKGPKGDKGVSLVNKGVWKENVDYTCDDVQIDFVTFNGSMYSCSQTHSSTEMIDPSNSEYWICIVEKGEKGDVGDTGPTGATGPTAVKVDNLMQETISLNTERNAAANKVAVQMIDASGNAVMIETLASQVYTKDGIPMQSLLNEAIFVLEESGGETICGDYEAYIDYLAKHQSTNEESEDEIL